MLLSKTVQLTVLALLSSACAQTYTSCDPTKKECPPDTALGVSNYTIDFQKSIMTDRVWNWTAGSADYGDQGAEFTINKRGDAPTVQTNFYIFFGQVEVWLKAAPGRGIVSSIVLESDDLDEVDWEWIGPNNTYVQSNYFGKGNTTSYDRAAIHEVDDAQGKFHNYTVDWTPEKLEWFIDGQSVRVLNYADANGGHNFPQTPCNVRLGIWAGGDPKNNQYTIDWAGGETDYSDSYTMAVQSVRVSDASTGTQYVYTDRSGSWQSIKALNVTKPLKLDGENSDSTSKTIKQKWDGLTSTQKYIIGGVVGGVALILIALYAWFCVRQRRAGKHEKLIEDAKYEKNVSEVMAYRSEMARSRNEKSQVQVHVSPVMNNGNGFGPTLHHQQSQPMMAAMRSPSPGYGYGRGYQKF
ncbi:hypothetical protein PV08_04702 [Exophiala spinifera]|uniref:chitinase n=1 Tax=Exophiala spinifera TaxID=91928 RepID=A0A0D2BEZ1_9EURO|nr:uncharacterized protein PV08_04702 [Exophiala spinifera]KIW17508.1 hypothetical protein PV08_04702 [Exophiala spinifera]